MVFYCCVCRNNSELNKEMSFFRFPGNPERKLKWIKNISLKIKDFNPPYPYSRICSAHFTESQLVKNKVRIRVLKSALPTADIYEPATENEGDEITTEQPDSDEHDIKEPDSDEHDIEETEEDEILLGDDEYEATDSDFSDSPPSNCMIVDDKNKVQNDKSVNKKSADIPSKSIKKIPKLNVGKYFRICDFCKPSRIFHSRVNYTLHQLTHVQDFNKKCDICKMEFCHSLDLLKHKQLHTAHDCTICRSKFETPKLLEIHQRKHIMRHFCDQCSYKSHRLYHFQQHKLKHTREKKYVCTECPFTTHRPNSIRIHRAKHGEAKKKETVGIVCKIDIVEYADDIEILENSDKKFKCKICEKRFLSKRIIVEHIMRHRKIKPYACGICSYRSVNLNYVKYHKMKKHKPVDLSQ